MENTNKKEQKTVAYDLKELYVDKSKNFILNIERSQNINIIIEYMMLSKIQSRIEYSINDKCFYLYDGGGKKKVLMEHGRLF